MDKKLAAFVETVLDRSLKQIQAKHQSDPPPEFVCPRCGRASWNRNDRIHDGYCGACHAFTAPTDGGPPDPPIDLIGSPLRDDE